MEVAKEGKYNQKRDKHECMHARTHINGVVRIVEVLREKDKVELVVLRVSGRGSVLVVCSIVVNKVHRNCVQVRVCTYV